MVGGEEQDSGVGSQDEEHLLSAYCLLPTFKALEQRRHLLSSARCPSRWRIGSFSGGYKGTPFME